MMQNQSYQINEGVLEKATEILLTEAALWCVLLCQSFTKRCDLHLVLDPDYSFLGFASIICVLV